MPDIKANTVTYAEKCRGAEVTDIVHALIGQLSSLYTEVARQEEYAELAGESCDLCPERRCEI